MKSSAKEHMMRQTSGMQWHADLQETTQLFAPFREIEWSAEFSQPREWQRMHAPKQWR